MDGVCIIIIIITIMIWSYRDIPKSLSTSATLLFSAPVTDAHFPSPTACAAESVVQLGL